MILSGNSKFDLGQKVYELIYVHVYEDRLCPTCEGEGTAQLANGTQLQCHRCHGVGRKSEHVGNKLVAKEYPAKIVSINVTFDTVRKSYRYRIQTKDDRGKGVVRTVTQSELETEENLQATLERRNKGKE